MRVLTAAILLIVLLTPGCSNMGAAARLGILTGRHKLVGRVLPVHSTFGKEVFEEVRRMSASVQEYCASNGDPDYIMIEQPGGLGALHSALS